MDGDRDLVLLVGALPRNALQRVQRTGTTQTITKNGTGTLTLGTAGTTDNNNLMALVVKQTACPVDL